MSVKIVATRFNTSHSSSGVEVSCVESDDAGKGQCWEVQVKPCGQSTHVSLEQYRNVVESFASAGYRFTATHIPGVVRLEEQVNIWAAVWDRVRTPLFWIVVGAGFNYIKSITPEQWTSILNGAVFRNETQPASGGTQ